MKALKKHLCLIIFVCLIFIFISYKSLQPGIPIYMYHSISETVLSEDESLSVKPSDFENHIKFIVENNYTPIFTSDLKHSYKYKKPVVITFDDGYLDNYTTAYPILKKYNIKATFFVISDKIDTDGYMTKEQLKELSDSGIISIQSHCATHPNLCKISLDKVNNEFQKSKLDIEQIINKKVTTISYPYGFTNKEIMKEASKYYDIAFITFGVKNYSNKIAMQVPRAGIFRDTTIEEFKTITKERSLNRLQKLLLYLQNTLF